MSDSILPEQATSRPEFLVILGLTPPVTVADVKQAYLEKVKTVHPDHGGDPQDFIRVHDAFNRATEYAKFKAGRMEWLSRWVEQYADQQEFISQVQALGGEVQVDATDWAAQSIGNDFATVLERIVGIRLSGPHIDDAFMLQLGAQHRILAGLQKIALVNTQVTAVGLRELQRFDSLRSVDLTGTRVTPHAARCLLDALDRLESLSLRKTGIGFWSRLKLRLMRRGAAISP